MTIGVNVMNTVSNTWAARLLWVGVCLLATGCASVSQIPNVELVEAPDTLKYPRPQAANASSPSGSLFASGSFRPGFEDPRARLVGDSLTIQITESLSASQSSSSDVNRSSDLSFGVSALPLLNPNSFGRANAAANTSNTFSGDGSTQATNTFSGSITAVVTEVLPNGHLVVVGEKQIGVNQNVDVLQFSGTVNPRTIGPGNSVRSTQVANVRVLSRGRGAQGEAQTFGWLSRFFLTLSPF
jgi:flagellar L-ring protein FlgH